MQHFTQTFRRYLYQIELSMPFKLLTIFCCCGLVCLSGCGDDYYNSYRNFITRLASDGNYEQVKKYIEAGGKVDSINKKYDCSSLLNAAACSGNLELVKYLVSQGARVNAYDSCGTTTLISSVACKKYLITEYLLQQGADVNAKETGEYDKGNTALLEAAYKFDFPTIKLLVEAGADVNARDGNGTFPLLSLIWYAQKDSVTEDSIVKAMDYLVTKGADVHFSKPDGTTVLTLASLREFKKVVEYLLAKGVNVNQKGEKGNTALTYAAYNGDKDIFEMLLAKGADMHAVLDDGSNVLLRSIESKNLPFIQSLVNDYGFDKNYEDSAGKNILCYAAKVGNPEVMAYILNSLKPDINSKDTSGKTPLFYAIDSYNLDNIKFLINNKAEINIQDNEGSTPLHHFTRSIYTDDSDVADPDKYYRTVAEYLLKSGANKYIKDNWGKRPYRYVDGPRTKNLRQLLD